MKLSNKIIWKKIVNPLCIYVSVTDAFFHDEITIIKNIHLYDLLKLRPFFKNFIIATIAIHKLVKMYVLKNTCKRKIKKIL